MSKVQWNNLHKKINISDDMRVRQKYIMKK
jgi:hypothetical protein